jgi:LacI family transcriptional regulator
MDAPTLKDLARLAGVHPSTVARVLNADPQQRVSPELRERIIALAREHGYQPNGLARALRLKRTRVIGTMIPDISNPFFAVMFRAIEDALADLDYSVILANTDDDLQREVRGMNMLRERQVDGLILATARSTDPAIAALAADRFPYVLINRHTDPLDDHAIVPDDFAGAVQAVEHLVSLGHRRIAHIAGPSDISTGYARHQGYAAAISRHGLPDDPSLIAPGTYREVGGYEAMRMLLALSVRPTAVFAVNDMAAIGAIRAVHEAGLSVPDDISIVGFNDVPAAAQLLVPLTTMRVPLQQLGRAAVDRLLQFIAGSSEQVAPIVLPVELVSRRSSARVRVLESLAT